MLKAASSGSVRERQRAQRRATATPQHRLSRPAKRKAKFRLDRHSPATHASEMGEKKGGFESKADAVAEDATRARRINATLTQLQAPNATSKPGRTSPTASQPGVPKINPRAAQRLQRRLMRGVRTGTPPRTLASFMHMREVRLEVIGAIMEALDGLPTAELRTVTVINRHWAISVADLDAVTAVAIKRQFRTHLQRAGILSMPGFLIAFLHGEFEPTSGTYQLHFHMVTTAAKAKAILRGLKGRWGYEKTATGASPIRRQAVKDRPRQLSYLLKGFWPAKPVVVIKGKSKRTRAPQRIKEPYHTQVLLWLNRQGLGGIMLLNQCRFRSGKLFIE